MLVNSRTKKNQFDFIKEVILFGTAKDDGTLFFAGWYADTDLSGMIKDDNVNGIRLRKGNILIGDNRTLDEFFGNSKTYQNFNRWFMGEIYVFDEGLIPNARRDDFEKNETYYEFKQKLEELTHKLARIPHARSKIRSNEKNLQEIPEKIEKINEELTNSGITDTRKEKLVEQIEALKKKAKNIDPRAYDKIKAPSPPPTSSRISSDKPLKVTQAANSPKIEEVKQTKNGLLNKLEDLGEQVESSTNYITQELPSHIPGRCRKEIYKIFNVIDRVLDEGLAKELKTQIIKELQPKSKKKRDNCK
ncbi:MAG: hypothetical protein D3905_15030 [Candidatus Electrothrix sp. AS4_5]|nr:hypothetical protein [Candidatus Electrothrix gigas]